MNRSMPQHTRSKIAVIKCSSYDPASVKAALQKAVDLLGGISRFVGTGASVLIKPNMLSPDPPEKAITTHPAVVRAVAELVSSDGGTPSIGDSPGFYSFKRVAAASGIAKAAEEAGARLTPFETGVEIATAENCLLKKIVVAQAVAGSDAIISVPKFKTHSLTYITAAVKNLLGCIPGLKKAEMHFRFPDNERFSRLLVAICLSIPVRLHILDAVVGMDGDGPNAGNPFPMGLIMAGADPVALDSVACRVVGIDPMTVPMLSIGQECGLGHATEDGIEIVGESIDDVRVDGFKAVPPGADVGKLLPLPEVVLRCIRKWVVKRPRIMRGACTRCGACVEVCPAKPKALNITAGGISVDDRNCILCYCCAEMCPSKAINLRRRLGAGIVARLLKL
jgi:uncharacterized protein (DUF362 family)/NAD-dependent dihydropyrimidine dehydrogenase PreA subunit